MDMNKKPWPLATLCGVRDRIDTNPDFQRPPVWTRAQKQFLIDTILRNMDIPKLYWQQTGRNPDTYSVVDGQQRLRAIWEFRSGEYKLPRDADPIEGIDITSKKYGELPDDLKMRFDIYPLDVVIVTDCEEDDVRDMFLRLQNGTPLKAQEKRNAMPGQMRDFIKALAGHKFFDSVAFKNSRYTFDLIAAQCSLIEINGRPCNVKNADLNRMYEEYVNFDANGQKAKRIRRVFDYLAGVFPEKTPELERFNVISLYVLVSSLLDRFVIDDRQKDLAAWFIKFEQTRRSDEQKLAEERDPELVIYHENISRSTDSEESIRKRNELLTGRFLLAHPEIEQKDDQRIFTAEQRLAIYRRDMGICQLRLRCDGIKCDWENWHADHKILWSKGGKTTVENGQVACPPCNLSKNTKVA
ncbi:MAG: HNH endonuclease family protein [Candidatus Hodarchaeota archaeon]